MRCNRTSAHESHHRGLRGAVRTKDGFRRLTKTLQISMYIVFMIILSTGANAKDDGLSSQEALQAYQDVKQAMLAGYANELPSCGETFASPEAAKKQSACEIAEYNAYSSVANSSGIQCLPECTEYVEYLTVDCQREVLALLAKVAETVVAGAENGTLSKGEQGLLESVFVSSWFRGYSGFPKGTGEPPAAGFLSSPAKIREFFTTRANLDWLKGLAEAWTNSYGEDYIQECVLVAASTDGAATVQESRGMLLTLPGFISLGIWSMLLVL